MPLVMPTRFLLLVCAAVASPGGPLPAQSTRREPLHPPPDLALPPARSDVPAAGALVPLQMGSGRPAVEAMVNGRGPFRFLVETGSAATILTGQAARRLGLVRDTSSANHRMIRIDSLRIGAAKLAGVNVLLVERLPGLVDGLIGLNAFADLLVTLDYPASRLRLESGRLPEADGRYIVRATRAGPFWAVDLDLAGRRVPAILDTQASSAFAVTPALADSLGFAGAPVVVGRARGPSIGDVERRSARLAGDVRVGSAVLERPLVDIIALPPMLATPALIGSKALRHFAITLDQRQGLLRLARATPGPVAAPPPLRSFGMMAPHDQDGVRRVAHVLPDSPADRAQVRAGDELVWADGRRAVDLTEAELATLADRDRPVWFLLRRDGAEREVALMPVVQVE